MNNRKIKICFLHPYIKDADSVVKYLHITGLPFAENIVWDDENPDYLFASEHIYFSPHFAKKFWELAHKPSIRIFHAGECVAPDLNIFDYAIVFDKKLSDMNRVCSMPTNLFFSNAISRTENNLTERQAKLLLRERKRFCNFLYSNGAAHPNRDKLFHALSSYKSVDSLGRHLNNIGALITGGGGQFGEHPVY